MQKIDPKYYKNFIRLAEANTCNTVYPMSIAEEVQEGDIYADSPENPTYALFWHVSGFAYLTGIPHKEDMDEIYALMKNQSGQNPRRFVLELKDDQTATYFERKDDVEKHPRYRFWLRDNAPEEDGQFEKPEQAIPDGFEMKEIDETLVKQITGRIVPSQFWSSAEEFVQKGKGYCLLKGGEVASVAFSAAVSSKQVDIGIETKECYRKKGLAAVVAGQMICYAKSIGKEPVWDCDKTNSGSKATAEKIGFKVMAEHAYYKV